MDDYTRQPASAYAAWRGPTGSNGPLYSWGAAVLVYTALLIARVTAAPPATREAPAKTGEGGAAVDAVREGALKLTGRWTGAIECPVVLRSDSLTDKGFVEDVLRPGIELPTGLEAAFAHDRGAWSGTLYV